MSDTTTRQDSAITLLTREELARRWRCCARTIIRQEAQGILSPIRLGPKLVRFRLGDIEAIEAQWAAQG